MSPDPEVKVGQVWVDDRSLRHEVLAVYDATISDGGLTMRVVMADVTGTNSTPVNEFTHGKRFLSSPNPEPNPNNSKSIQGFGTSEPTGEGRREESE